jgi:hypothetical protein
VCGYQSSDREEGIEKECSEFLLHSAVDRSGDDAQHDEEDVTVTMDSDRRRFLEREADKSARVAPLRENNSRNGDYTDLDDDERGRDMRRSRGSESSTKYVIDDRGWWIRWDVSPDHWLYGCYAAIQQDEIPQHANVEVVKGNLQGKRIHRSCEMEREAQEQGRQHDGGGDRSHSLKKRDKEMEELKENLAQVKAKLAKQDKERKDRKITIQEPRTEYETESGMETSTERRKKVVRSRGNSEKEHSASDYETCRDSDWKNRASGSEERPASKMLRKKKYKRSSEASESESDSQVPTTSSLMSMMRKCLKDELETIIEEKTGKDASGGTPLKKNEESKVSEKNPEPKNSIETKQERNEGTNPTVVAAAVKGGIPMMKFNGEHWDDFIEHFESLGEACKWSDAVKLQMLLMSLEGKPRGYAKREKDQPHSYDIVRRRLQHRYGTKQTTFEIRRQLREARREPHETLEEFADRLQEIAQQGSIDERDRDELFYWAYLQSLDDMPKMQNHIENAHTSNRRMQLSELLNLSREYLEKSPTTKRRSVAVSVCKPYTQRKGMLSHEDPMVDDNVVEEKEKIVEEKREREENSLQTLNKEMKFCMKELAFHTKCIKLNGLHRDLREKAKNFTGTMAPREAPSTYLNFLKQQKKYEGGDSANNSGGKYNKNKSYNASQHQVEEEKDE